MKRAVKWVRAIAVLVAAAMAQVQLLADTYTWNAGDGDWGTAENWTLASTGEPATTAPGTGDAVVLVAPQGVTNTVTVLSAIKIGSLSVGGTGNGKIILSFKNGLTTNEVTGTVHVYSGGYITHYGPSDNVYHLNLKVGGDMTIDLGGFVDSRARGFGTGRGVTNTGAIGSGSSKGCHGGRGLNKSYCYGSVRNPVLPGMGGVSRGSSWTNRGWGLGGGVVYLEVTGNLVVNGDLTSDAGDEYDQSQAGGSLLVRCAALSGTGRVSACATRGSAGGGRIAIYQTTAQALAFNGLLGTAGGTAFQRYYTFYHIPFSGTYIPANKTANYYYGTSYGAGTIYIENANDPSGRGTLLVKGCNANNSLQSSYTEISSLVGGSQEPFGEVIVTNGARLYVGAGCTLRVQRKLDTRGGQLVLQDNTAFVEFVGNDDFEYFGSNTLINVKCTVPGKKIYFGAPSSLSKLVIPAGGSLVLTGVENNPISLLPTNPAQEWWLAKNADASFSIDHVAVSNCNASAGDGILAIDSTDLGGNTKWSFSAAIVPGVTNTWTGTISTDWAEGGNWSLDRQVQDTDVALVPAAPANQPVIPIGTMSLNEVIVESGASLTLAGGCDVTVTNSFRCAGALNFTNKEKLTFAGDADLSGATIAKAFGRVYIVGDGTNTVDLDAKQFHKVIIRRTGGSLSLNGGFSAHVLRCLATNAVQSIAVEQGTTIAADEMYVNGLAGSEKRLTLRSSVSGSKWHLNATALDQFVTGAVLSDCDASGGAKVVAGANSTDAGGNDNFDFTTATAVWNGGTGTFATAAKWSPAAVPGPSARCAIIAEEGESFTVTVGAVAGIGSLVASGTDGATLTFLANSALAVEGDLVAHTNVVLSFNAYDNSGDAPISVGGDFYLRAGCVMNHTGPANTENAKIHLSVGGDMLVAPGASIDVKAKGYSHQYGPGHYFNSATSLGHLVAHGGIGPSYGERYVSCYGSVFRPFRWGSGSATHTGTDISLAYRNGGQGGGAINVSVGGTLTHNGVITADGSNEYDSAPTGGSICLDVGRLVGSGPITARPGSRSVSSGTRYGGGGRIAIYQRNLPSLSLFDGTISTTWPSSLTLRSEYGGAGTIFISCSNTAEAGDDLYVRSDLVTPSHTQLPMAADYAAEADLLTAFRNVNLVISNSTVSVTNNSAAWTVGATVRVRDLDLSTAGSKLILNGSTIEVMDLAHKNGRGWHYGSYEAAVAAGKVVLGEVNGVPGKVVWRRRGLAVTLR